MSILRYLISLLIFIIAWAAAALGLGSVLSNMIPFQIITPEDFLKLFQIILGVVAGLSAILTFIWFLYGNRDKAALNLRGAKSTWNLLFIISIVISALNVVFFFIRLTSETVPVTAYLLMYVCGALVSWIAFWVVCLFWSPTNVKYCVALKK